MNGEQGDGGVAQPACAFCTFGLIVTGEGERDFLPSFFRTLMERAGCTFKVLRQIGQRSPISAPSRQRELQIVGTGAKVLPKDVEEFGLEARRFLKDQPCHFVLLIDDVEAARLEVLPAIFARYRQSLDAVLIPANLNSRAAVHFFANMVEAYYFAHADAVNIALETDVLDADYADDVEKIGHPKNELKHRFQGFDEKTHGAAIVGNLDLDHVLSRPKSCAYLRALFGWCVRMLTQYCQVYDQTLPTRYGLSEGVQAELTRHQ